MLISRRCFSLLTQWLAALCGWLDMPFSFSPLPMRQLLCCYVVAILVRNVEYCVCVLQRCCDMLSGEIKAGLMAWKSHSTEKKCERGKGRRGKRGEEKRNATARPPNQLSLVQTVTSHSLRSLVSVSEPNNRTFLPRSPLVHALWWSYSLRGGIPEEENMVIRWSTENRQRERETTSDVSGGPHWLLWSWLVGCKQGLDSPSDRSYRSSTIKQIWPDWSTKASSAWRWRYTYVWDEIIVIAAKVIYWPLIFILSN